MDGDDGLYEARGTTTRPRKNAESIALFQPKSEKAIAPLGDGAFYD
jgi:hypothetical protein